MKNRIHVACLSVFIIFQTTAQQFPAGFLAQQLVPDLDPTDLVITPDHRILITVKSGKILVIEDEQLAPAVFLNIESAVDNFNERGLGHMVLDPDFEGNHYYYVYYTEKSTNRNRISRFTANGNSTLPGSELVLLQLDVMAGTIHNGGDMAFGPDGKLYVSTGDGADANTSQQLTNLLGKVLRINADGSIPTDNPFYNQTTGNNRAIWALGFRNPFSMDIQPLTGKVFVCDVGASAWEEVNHAQAGKNYGWPLIEGKRTNQTPPANYQDPLYAYSHSEGCSVVGAAFYNPEQERFPAVYVGKFFFADYCGGYIKNIDPDNGAVSPFATGIDRPLAFVVDSDGAFYYLERSGLGGGSTGDNTTTPDGSLWKVTYTGSGEPFIGSNPEDLLASVGEDAAFTVSASGAEPLTYQWQVNGTDIPGATTSSYTFQNAQLTDDGKFFRCVVSNAIGQATSDAATLSVTSNTRPVPVILTPIPGTLYRAGESFSFSGEASDSEDGTLPDSQLTWKIDFHHDEHSHPALENTDSIASGSYEVPKVGETDDNVWYRVYLTATDNMGLSKTVFLDVLPEKTTFTVASEPSGLSVFIDGQPSQTPVTIISVVGITRTLEAPTSQYSGSDFYVYNQWTDVALSRSFTFDVPLEAASYTAQFSLVPTGEGNGLEGSYYNQSRTFNNPPNLFRLDPTINFDWGGESPQNGLIRNDNFAAHWEGYVLPQFTDTYTFYTVSDDGVRLWIDNQLIIDKWIPQAATEWSGQIQLDSGEFYRIKLDYFEDAGAAVMKLLWKSTLLPKQIVPQSQLYANVITGTDPFPGKVEVYPTVTDQHLTVVLGKTADAIWGIYNVVGMSVMEGTSNKDFLIDVRELQGGFYLLRINDLVFRFIRK